MFLMWLCFIKWWKKFNLAYVIISQRRLEIWRICGIFLKIKQ